MIKKTILMLLVLVGGVMSANAWTDIYLRCDGHWDSNDEAYKFTKINGNQFYIDLDGSVVNDGSFYFRFWVSDLKNGNGNTIEPASSQENNDQEVTTTAITSNFESYSGHTQKAFYITQDENAEKVRIFLNYYDDGGWIWHISAAKLKTYTVSYVNDTNFPNVYFYSYVTPDFMKFNGDWPGTMIEESAGVYTSTFLASTEYAKIIFNKGDGGDGNQSSTFDLVENAVYTCSQKVGDQTVSIAKDYGTFASPYPLTFPENGEIFAYKASQVSGNKMIMERVTGTVPAKTGLFLAKNTANTMTVSPCAKVDVDASVNYLKAGGISVTSDASYNRYGFQTQGSDMGFYKISGNAVAVPENKAYLELPATVAAPSLSIELDGETTGIKVINWEDVDANNDGQVYDLQGRRVYQPTTGIFIKNGKKVIVK